MMNLCEYQERLSQIDKEYNEKKNSLYKEFALSRNKVKIGDIIQDSTTIIKVEKIKIFLDINCIPQCVYYGMEMRKDKMPKAKYKLGQVFQNNLKKIL